MSDEKIVRFQSRLLSEGFTMVPNVVLLNSALTLGARMVHAALCFYARQSNSAYPGQPKLAGMLGISERSLRDYLRELEEVKLLETTRRRSTSNLYTLLDPSDEYMSKLESARSAGTESGPADLAGTEAAESAGTVPAKSAAEEYAVGNEDAVREEDTPLGDESPSHLPGLAPPAPKKSAKQLEAEALEPLVEELWAFHVSVFGEGRVGLTEPRRKTLRGGLNAVNKDLELCKRACLGLKAYRDSHPEGSKDTSVSVVFETNIRDSRNRTEKIMWWADQADGKTATASDPLASVPEVQRAIVRDRMYKANRVIQGRPLDESGKADGEEAIEWLHANHGLVGTLTEEKTVKWERR